MRTQFSYLSDNKRGGRESLAVQESPFWNVLFRQRFPTPSGGHPQLWRRLLPRLFRLAVLAAAAALVYAASLRPRPADDVSLADARMFFSDAAQLAAGDRRLGGQT